MATTQIQTAQLIPVDKITVVNPRVRNQRAFREIVANIAEVGLKRPITVAKRESKEGSSYDLVCGQGRLEAFQELGQHKIPAIIISASNEDCMVMSLVENLARCRHKALDLLRDIGGLKQRGYKASEIARKTGLSVRYVRSVIHLLECGEHRLLRAVESGKFPISVAVEIAEAEDTEVQKVLHQAYANNLLRGGRLMAAKRLVEARQRHGKGRPTVYQTFPRSLSLETLLKTYQNDVEKKQVLLRNAAATRNELLFIVEALRTLWNDENFVTLLQAEGLSTIPKNLTERLAARSGEV